MKTATCTAPRSAPASCTFVPLRRLTPTEAMLADAGALEAMSSREIVLHAPIGTLLFVDYVSGGTSRSEAPDTEFTLGIDHHHYFGRLISREDHGTHYIFRMACTLTRGSAHEPAFRTFSTRKGEVRNVQVMEFPRPEARA